MHDSAAADFQKFVGKFLNPDEPLRIADVGSYNVNGTLRELLPAGHRWTYVGFDIKPGPNVDVVINDEGTGEHAGSFDVVAASQVLEHVRKPWEWIHFLAGLTHRGGLVYVCAPNTWTYHKYPVDCWRVWPEGMRSLFETAGLETVEAYFEGPDTTGIARKR